MKRPAVKQVKKAKLTAVSPLTKHNVFPKHFLKVFRKNKKNSNKIPLDFIAKSRKKATLKKKRQQMLVPALVVISLIACLLSVYKPAKTYIQTKNRINNTQKINLDYKKQLEKKQAELKRWDDPAFVEAQIRNRLSYVKKGETPYAVLNPDNQKNSNK
jgi:cell division protein FtsB